jgi:hypothetical protein
MRERVLSIMAAGGCYIITEDGLNDGHGINAHICTALFDFNCDPLNF